MSDLIREAAIGQIIRFVTNKKYLQYPEEKEDFVNPNVYSNPDVLLGPKTISEEDSTKDTPSRTPALTPANELPDQVESLGSTTMNSNVELEKAETQFEGIRPAPAGPRGYPNTLGIRRTKTREETLPFTNERIEVERIATIERAASSPIVPAVTNQGDILVDWYTTDVASNPQNWSLGEKNFATFILWQLSLLYSLSDFIRSKLIIVVSIYS
jgi:DHA1 family multidrug resistance protein-like MFS transporter